MNYSNDYHQENGSNFICEIATWKCLLNNFNISNSEMDLETKNRIAAILMKEAAELRREAARDGIYAYLCPNVRGRPNSRFLTATVLGVQQSNRAVEVNEMWRAREKEKEMDNGSRKDEKRGDRKKNTSTRFEDYERKHTSLCSSSKSAMEGELKDNEIEEFLHSRAKRGRGTIGSRMDEAGPYLPDSKHPIDIDMEYRESRRAILGPEKPLNLKSNSSSDESCEEREERAKRSKHHCRKHKDKKTKKRKREKKRSKHHN
ncbi:hypothetical protein L1987_19512 [Smallanthus sonchifolius]|uniref:Uncharacterized protein n=1 Tax=Smallanthus sonchifolius TaxID=185202 RepID=A0ACB9IPI3_9ASTR|nr:hypothetical protein L1987_19512 [Smallanthus sonchifolius]